MTSIYVHLSGRDVDGALLRLNGIETAAKKQESIMAPKKCPRCQEANQATNKFCSRCGIALDSEAKLDVIRHTLERKDADAVLDRLLEDREFREMFVRKLQMANLSKPRAF